MEELIPLIIGIVWLVYSFYNKGQKRKAREGAPDSADDAQKKPSVLEQLLAGEGFQVGEPEEEVYDETPVYEPVEESEVRQKARQEYKPFLQSEISQFSEEGESQFSEFFDDEEEDFSGPYFSSDYVLDEQGFDLKKAVIYSEILNAPYIDYK